MADHQDLYLNTSQLKTTYFLTIIHLNLMRSFHNVEDREFQTLQSKSFDQNYRCQKEDVVNIPISTSFNKYIDIFKVIHDSKYECILKLKLNFS
jgi:hypothetical protein